MLRLSILLLCGALNPALAQQVTLISTPAPVEAAPTEPTPAAPVSETTAPAETSVLIPPAATVDTILNFAAVQQALKTSLAWRSADESYKAAQYNLAAARARAGLNLTVGAEGQVGTVFQNDSTWQAGATLTAQVGLAVLPWGSANDPVGVAERSLSRAAVDLQNTRQNLILSALQSYLNARNAAAQAALSSLQVALAQRQFGVGTVQRSSNLLSAEGLLERQVNLEQAQAKVQDSAASRELTQRRLLSDLGLDSAFGSNLVLPSLPSLPSAPAPLSSLLATALQRRSEVQKAASQVADAHAQLTAATRERFPDISGNLSYGENGTGNSGRTIGGSLNLKTGVAAANLNFPLKASQTPIPTSMSLGLSGNFNVFGSVANAAIEGAQSSLKSAELALQSARTSVELDVRSKYNDALNTRSTVEVQQTALTRTQTALNSARARLDAGIVTGLDVQVAEVNLQTAQVNLDQAVSTAYLTKLQLDQASAQFDPALILAP